MKHLLSVNLSRMVLKKESGTVRTYILMYGNSVITDGSQYNKSVGSQVEFWILLLCTKDILLY